MSTVITLNPTKYNSVSASFPTTINQNGARGVVGKDPGDPNPDEQTDLGLNRGWIQFDLSSLPADKDINSAVLEIDTFYRSFAPTDPYGTLQINAAPSSNTTWDGTTLTWNNAPNGSVGSVSGSWIFDSGISNNTLSIDLTTDVTIAGTGQVAWRLIESAEGDGFGANLVGTTFSLPRLIVTYDDSNIGPTTDNAYVLVGNPNENQSPFNYLNIGDSDFNEGLECQAWLKFDLRNYTHDMVVVSATLNMYIFYLTGASVFSLYYCSNNHWTSSTITYNNAPALSVSSTSCGSWTDPGVSGPITADLTSIIQAHLGEIVSFKIVRTTAGYGLTEAVSALDYGLGYPNLAIAIAPHTQLGKAEVGACEIH